MKVYLKEGIITLVSEGKTKLVFTAGNALTTIGEESPEPHPYSFFKEYNSEEFRSLVYSELDKLHALGEKTSRALVCMLDKGRKDKLYLNRAFQLSLATVDGEAVLLFQLRTAYELLALEMISALSRGKPLKKCENCGKYFFPSGRSDSVYCDRIGSDGFSCKKIGACRQYRRNSRSDSIKQMYDKVTKHNRYLKNKGLIPEEDFLRWMTDASVMHARFRNGEISEDTFSNWLSEDLNAKGRPARRSEISDYLL